jgi:hypothetical protein
MKKQKAQYAWVKSPVHIKFGASKKAEILGWVQEFIKKSNKLSHRVSRTAIRGSRIYLYQLVEQLKLEGAEFTEPLIEDEYLEFPYARITIQNSAVTECTVDWQRHNEKWMTLYSGSLDECLSSIEKDEGWFA